jgi:FkbM family methyltransferase
MPPMATLLRQVTPGCAMAIGETMLNAIRHITRHPLNADRRARGILRFVRWQLATRLVPGSPIAVPFTDRARLLLSPGMHGATQNYYCGLNDFEDMCFLLHYLRAGDTFVDVGANVGAYTVLASKVSGAFTHAFEPGAEAADALMANAALNHIEDRVKLRRCAVGRVSGTVRFAANGSGAMHHVARPGEPAGSVAVEMLTLDDCALSPSILKIDTEGYEAEVLAGASRTLSDPELVAVIAEENDEDAQYGEGIAPVREVMFRLGFAACNYDPWTRTLRPWDVKRDNTLFVRSTADVTQRLRDAPPIHVLGKVI